MSSGFVDIPRAGRWTITGARVPVCLLTEADRFAPDQDGLAPALIEIDEGRIAAIRPSNEREQQPATASADLKGGLVLPAFVEVHTHLDKGHIWPRRRNPDGSFFGALNAVALDRTENWSAADVAARMDFSLRCAHAHGTSAMRTHLDSQGRQTGISWRVFAEMRDKWRGRVDLQAVALFSIELVPDRAHMSAVRAAVVEHGGVMGGVTYMVPELDDSLDVLFRLASEEGLDLDFHVDETQDPESRTLRHIAEAALRHRFSGQVTVGHCCSLARQDEDEAKATIDKVAEAGIAVVSLPMCNLYLQDRSPARTPRYRGITLLHELKAAGADVCIASDNTRDPFYAYGDLDALEVFREAARIAHLDHPFGDWLGAITRTPARVMGIEAGTLREGAPADLVLVSARSYTELLARPQADRVVIRAGAAIDTRLPDYRELDEVVGVP